MNIPKELIDKGYVSVKKHPELDYYIYNYTNQTQYEGYWDEWTKACRGLILDGKGNIVARPFSKFFNLQEHNKDSYAGPLPVDSQEDWEVYEKMDGSLGILYPTPNGLSMATRGSFESPQAFKGLSMLNDLPYVTLLMLNKLAKYYTFLFEIIYPENRIVVDYADEQQLILLAVVENSTGEEWSYPVMEAFCNSYGIDLVPCYGHKQLEEIEDEGGNREGFVLKTQNNFRVKVKFKEYVRLHRILTECSSYTIWDLLRTGQGLEEVLDRVPDEFYNWVRKMERDLNRHYSCIATYCRVYLSDIPSLTESKERGIIAEVAELIKSSRYPSVIFAMWRGKDYKDIIWKLCKPEYEKPFSDELNEQEINQGE